MLRGYKAISLAKIDDMNRSKGEDVVGKEISSPNPAHRILHHNSTCIPLHEPTRLHKPRNWRYALSYLIYTHSVHSYRKQRGAEEKFEYLEIKIGLSRYSKRLSDFHMHSMRHNKSFCSKTYRVRGSQNRMIAGTTRERDAERWYWYLPIHVNLFAKCPRTWLSVPSATSASLLLSILLCWHRKERWGEWDADFPFLCLHNICEETQWGGKAV